MKSKGLVLEPKVLLGVLAVLVLIVLFIFVSGVFGRLNELASYIPGFDRIVVPPSDVKIFGLNLDDGRVAYYTGTKWKEIPLDKNGLTAVNYEIGKLGIPARSFGDELLRFYYTEKDTEEGLLALQSGNRLVPKPLRIFPPLPEGEKDALFEDYPLLKAPETPIVAAIVNSVGIELNGISHPEVYGYIADYGDLLNGKAKGAYVNFYVDTNNKIYFGTFGEGFKVKSGGSYDKIRDYAVEWRDSILKGHSNAKTVSLSYRIKENNEEVVGNYCVEGVDNYLVVNLDKSVTDERGCYG